MEMKKKAWRIVRNKYFITSVAFVAWTLFFDQNDWLSLKERQRELDEVKDNITYLNREIAVMNDEKTGLMNDPHKLEQYAREHFRMKHEGEDIYVIEQPAANADNGESKEKK